MLEINKLKYLLEAILLANDKPMTEDQLLAIFSEEEKPALGVLRQALQDLQADLEERGIELVQVASGYRFQVKSEWVPWVSRLWEEKAQRYSRALLETLALIAYRQPITRGEIEDIRGVTVSTTIIKTLLEDREWIRVVGHREVPGRPALYATTKGFLDYFGLKNLQDLPPLPEILNLDNVDITAPLEEGLIHANEEENAILHITSPAREELSEEDIEDIEGINEESEDEEELEILEEMNEDETDEEEISEEELMEELDEELSEELIEEFIEETSEEKNEEAINI